MLPLLVGAVHDGLLTLDDVVARLHTNPVALFDLDLGEDSWVEIDPDAVHEIGPGSSMSGWSPFEGTTVRGQVVRTIVRGLIAYEHGTVIARSGTGRDLRKEDGR